MNVDKLIAIAEIDVTNCFKQEIFGRKWSQFLRINS